MVTNNLVLDITNPDTWPEWLTVDQISVILSIPKSTVYQLFRENKLKAQKFGRQIRMNKKDLC